jgi:hypothetical protein
MKVLPVAVSMSGAFESLGATVLTGARNEENGTPPFRANAQSWRDAVARTAIALPVKLIITTAVITFVAARLLVAA